MAISLLFHRTKDDLLQIKLPVVAAILIPRSQKGRYSDTAVSEEVNLQSMRAAESPGEAHQTQRTHELAYCLEG